jgi:hypothetical protein
VKKLALRPGCDSLSLQCEVIRWRAKRGSFGRIGFRRDLRIKQFEIARYQAEVTEWEQKEYFELF